MQNKHLKFAARLRELREEANVSMLELAKAIGVSDAAVCKWENGKAEPKASYIVRLAEYFDCPIDYLLGIDGDYKSQHVKIRVTDAGGKKWNQKPPLATITTDEKIVVDTYNKLSPAMKDLLKDTLKTWVASAEQRSEKPNNG